MPENTEIRNSPLREKYGLPYQSDAWEAWNPTPPIIRIQTDDEAWYGVPFSKIASLVCTPTQQKLRIIAESTGDFVVKGLKAQDLFKELSLNRVSAIRVDNKDIVSIEFIPAKKKED
jgi:hypothetical protein